MSWFGTSKRNDPPKCFGKSWDSSASECAGGADPAFSEERLDTKTGEKYLSHIREKCGYFDDCGSRTQALKMQQASNQLVPATSLARAWTGRPTGTAPAPTLPTVTASPAAPTGQPAAQQFGMQQLQHQFMQMQQQYMQQQMEMMRRGQMPAQMPGMVAPPQMMGMPQMGFQQMMPVNFEIPQYLTRREYRRPDEGITRVLGREVFRSMMKSAGHTFANFFDSTPFFGPPPKE